MLYCTLLFDLFYYYLFIMSLVTHEGSLADGLDHGLEGQEKRRHGTLESVDSVGNVVDALCQLRIEGIRRSLLC